jgi:hypothetical protein
VLPDSLVFVGSREEATRTMKTASWVLIAFVGVAALVLSLVATTRAYSGYRDNFGGGEGKKA